jgi:hypothetical protein
MLSLLYLRVEQCNQSSLKPVKEQKHKGKVPMFSISELQSDKYASTSSKAKDIGRTKKNDLDL